ncbi:MAG TPA: phage portal protein [Anaerolineae bacterium]|nr:phage portal protein [Anaerolineae bacterium]
MMDNLRLWAAMTLVKASRVAVFPDWMRHSFMDITFPTLVREGYKKNSAVFSCVQALAFGFSEPRLRVYTDGSPDDAHPLVRLLRHPNPDMGMKSLLQYTMTYVAIGGNCYWLKVYNGRNEVVELWPLHDGQMTPVPGGTRMIKHYELLDVDGVKVDDIPRERVIHFRWAVDPLQPWRGMSPLVAVAREADLDSEMTDYTFALLKNNAVPPLALIAPEHVILQDYQIRRMKQEWAEQYGGENRGKPAILEGGVDIKQLSFDINRLAAEAMRNIPESRICAAFKVPPTVALLYVGLQHMTYDNVQGMLRYFTEQTLIPMWDRFDDIITHDLSTDFDMEDSEVQFDIRGVVALQRKRLELGEFVDRAVRGGYMTRNEARAELSLPETRDGDVFLVSFSTVSEPALSKTALSQSEAKSLKVTTSESRRQAALMVGRTLQSIRKSVEVRMAADVERFFYDLAERVIERARGLTEAGVRASVLEWKLAGWEPGQHDPTTACGLAALVKATQLTLPGLFDDADFGDLLHVFGFWAYTILEESWDTWNYALDVTLSFNRNDPAVVALVQTLGDRITLISEATRNGVREILAEGYQRGWSIEHIVMGDPEAGIPGLRETVSGLTYRGPDGRLITLTPEQRARMIARTELGTAQNMTTYSRYANAGVERVLVLDDSFDNSHEFCRAINGKVVPLSWAQGHALCHPNCVRAFAPEFDAPVDEGAIEAAEAAGTCPFG